MALSHQFEETGRILSVVSFPKPARKASYLAKPGIAEGVSLG
jgi:hypothetical protein